MDLNIGAGVLRDDRPASFTKEVFKKWLEWHGREVERYEELKKYYVGEQAIQSRTVKIKNNANNKVTVNLCNYINETLASYFMSNAVVYKGDESTEDVVKKISRMNVSDEHDFELAKAMGMYGHAFEILYYDVAGNVRFEQLTPLDTFIVYDANLTGEKKMFAVRYIVKGEGAKKTYTVNVYDEKNVITYTLNSKYEVINTDENLHLYVGIPVIEYKNNDERIGDFEAIISLQDAYNTITSDRVNNIENVVNSLLVLTGYNMDDAETSEMVKTLKKHGVLTVDEHGDAKYISNPIQGATVEQLRKDLKDDIFTISCCPNMSDEKFSGNTSGISMKYKMWNTEQKTGVKEKKFKKALTERWYLISMTPKVTGLDIMSLDMVFSRNLPTNGVEVLESAKNIYGTISERSYIELIGEHVGIEDVDAEIELLKQEKESSLGDYFQENREV